jgi:hypothetical protein
LDRKDRKDRVVVCACAAIALANSGAKREHADQYRQRTASFCRTVFSPDLMATADLMEDSRLQTRRS